MMIRIKEARVLRRADGERTGFGLYLMGPRYFWYTLEDGGPKNEEESWQSSANLNADERVEELLRKFPEAEYQVEIIS